MCNKTWSLTKSLFEELNCVLGTWWFVRVLHVAPHPHPLLITGNEWQQLSRRTLSATLPACVWVCVYESERERQTAREADGKEGFGNRSESSHSDYHCPLFLRHQPLFYLFSMIFYINDSPFGPPLWKSSVLSWLTGCYCIRRRE